VCHSVPVELGARVRSVSRDPLALGLSRGFSDYSLSPQRQWKELRCSLSLSPPPGCQGSHRQESSEVFCPGGQASIRIARLLGTVGRL